MLLSTKSYLKHRHHSTSGRLVKVVREHYLRNDLHCGFPSCHLCCCPLVDGGVFPLGQPNVSGPLHETLLSSAHPYYLIPDTNVILNQIDLMEHALVKHVIILQTVLQEVRHNSIPVYNRLRALISASTAAATGSSSAVGNHHDPETSKHFYVFCNENHAEAYVADRASPTESSNDRNDRAIRVAAAWYQRHLPSPIRVILLTDDVENGRIARKDYALTTLSSTEFVHLYPDTDGLADIISAREEITAASTAGEDEFEGFEVHATPAVLSAGLKLKDPAARFYQGTLSISPYNHLEGTIIIRNRPGAAATDSSQKGEDVEEKIYIVGRMRLNRAIHGDVVAVQLVPAPVSDATSIAPDALASGGGVLVDPDMDEGEVEKLLPTAVEGDASPTKMDIDKDEADKDSNTKTILYGKIVGIVKRNARQYCGVLDVDPACAIPSSLPTTRSLFFIPLDRKIPKIRIRTRQAHILANHRIIVAMDDWAIHSKYPVGHFVRDLGPVGDKETEGQVLLLEHDVPFAPFSRAVLNDLPEEGTAWTVGPTHFADPHRTDLTHLDVCSIDPPGCTDIDDALHAITLPNGNIQVGVHIADVSSFVQPGTAMDAEAQRRSTTVYLVDKRIDMLPSLLGTNLCSLKSNVLRLAFTAMFEIDAATYEVVRTTFMKSIIRSRASLAYAEAQLKLDDPNAKDSVSQGIKLLNSIAVRMRKRRMEAGSLVLASPQVKFSLADGSDDPVDVECKELTAANALVEEFMLLANIHVAQAIHKHFPDSCLLRRHPAPPVTNFTDLNDSLQETVGQKLDITSSKSLADSLDRLNHPSDPFFNRLVRIMTTRCMLQAVYFSSGSLPEAEFWHYGLAAPMYTHFTSPIRRYADLVVHRMLAAAIGLNAMKRGMDAREAKEMSDVLNFRHTMAQKASRASAELYTHLFFRGKVLEEDAYIIRMMKNGIVALIPKFGLEGVCLTTGYDYATAPVRLREITDSGEGRVLRLFQRIRVRISIAENSHGRNKLVLELLNE